MLFSKACDITGIVAVACARHGCFAPNSIVNLYRGEQQKNVDWAFLEALKTTCVQGDQSVMLFYDLICQYCIYLRERIGDQLPPGLELDYAIGLFHVHGHKEVCFFRYAPSFIPQSGVVAGEILESLWANMNMITPSTRMATLAHRTEMIEDHASDSNFKKLISMGGVTLDLSEINKLTDITASVLSDRYVHADSMAREARNYYDNLTATISPNDIEQWEEEI
jgi:hypothetical protein